MSAIARDVIVVSDAHHPYHDPRAWNCCLTAIKAVGPTDVVIIGDAIDAYPVSRFGKSPERRADLKYEIDLCNKELDRLGKAAGRARVHFLAGNHEYRLQTFLADKAPELYGLLKMEQLLHVRERGWRWTPYKRHIEIGKVSYTHDVGRCGKNAIAQSLADFGGSLVIGHTHRLGVAYEGNVKGDHRVAMSVGWLGDFEQVDYKMLALARREWSHGFGHVSYLRNGVGFVQAIPIIKGVAVVDGVKVTG